MLKLIIIVSTVLFIYVTHIHGNPQDQMEDFSPATVTFIKPKASIMRRINPLKLFFTVAHTPSREPPYSIEWNLSLLTTMILESAHISKDDKELFLTKFSNADNEYANWSQEQHDELERFTEKYFNIYKSPESFLPFVDCNALTYAITDEMLSDLQPRVSDEKRAKIRAKAVASLCESE